ncbi:uncharacterized protein LOC116291804 isoform X2 [Actinia tenebrosa]|uniref:Uncharacterized protein LOC116291804 isoform X2 n=1 Tax=Actinia tenebrosa TaxID=6105 RepID=A0A6P8HQG2_ACTTE|nr:uncharacterized protein LOC116291804 isoform X2 [Actinia tenebrosa]
MRPQNHQLEKNPNAPRKVHSRLALAFIRDFRAKRNSVWILLILLLAQVLCSKATLKQDASSCSQIGRPESNVTLMNGLDNPKVHRFILGHVKTLEDCVQIACKRENISLAYISRFDCFGISCDGEEETCWLLPSFQYPTLVFARLQRGIPKVHNTTINKAGKLSKVHAKQKHEKKTRNIDENQRKGSSSNEGFSSSLNFKRRSNDAEVISTLSSRTRSRTNGIPLVKGKHELSQRSVGERPFLELPYLWKRRRKANQRIRRDVIKHESILGGHFAIRNYDAENGRNRRDSYFDKNIKPLDRQNREMQDDLPREKEDEAMLSDSDMESSQTVYSGSGNEEINNDIQNNNGRIESSQTSLSGSGSDVRMKSQEVLQRYKRNFDDEDEDDDSHSSDDSLPFLGENKMKDEQQDNELQRYKRKLDDDDDDVSSADVWSSGNGISHPPSDPYSGYNDQNEDSEEGNSLRRYKRKAVEPEEMDELSKALSSASPSKRSLEEEEELGSGVPDRTRSTTKNIQSSSSSPSTLSSSSSPSSSSTLAPSSSTATSSIATSSSSPSPSTDQSQVKSENNSKKSKKNISLPVKNADASPQETSSSSSASISISSLPPPPPPPPPSSTSSSSSISVTTSSTGSLPVSQSSQTSTTKVSSSSTTFPKSLDSKKKDAPEKPVKLVSLTKKGSIKIHQGTLNKDTKKSSAVPPQESTSSSSSTSITISPLPLPLPLPPPSSSSTSTSSTSVSQSSSSSTKVSVSTSTFPKVKSSKTNDASKKHVKKTTKKSSAVPPQESTSSTSSTSISISPIPLPLPPLPPPSSSSSSSSTTSTTQSSSSSTKVSVSTSSFPKVKSSKTNDASKKHVKMAAASSSKSLKSSSSKTKAAKSRSTYSISPKKEKSFREKAKQKKQSTKTLLKEKRNKQENKKKIAKEKVDRPTQKQKRQAPYEIGLRNRMRISSYNQATRSNIRPVFASTVGYNRAKMGQGTQYKPQQESGPFSAPSYQYKQINAYRLQGRNNAMTSSIQPVVSSFGAQSAQLYVALRTHLPLRSVIPGPSVHFGFSHDQPRSFIPPTNYAKPNGVRPGYQQIRFPGRTYRPAYGAQPTIPDRFQDHGGSVLAAQMKSLKSQYKNMKYTPTRPDEEKTNVGQGFEGKSCSFPLGMQDGTIKDEQLSSSSDYSMYHSAARGRLGNTPKQNGFAGAWCTGTKHIDRAQYLQIDLGQRRRVCRVATQGMPEFPTWVKEYTLEFSNNGHIWADYTEEGHEKLFDGNTDSTTPVSHSLKQPITARFIRFKPQSWNGPNICMRAELYTSTDPGLKPRDRISKQGLVVYLNFDKSKETSTDDRRTEISRAPGVCGDVASLRDGKTILLDGRKIQPKPRDAITIAAWIRLDNTSGQHSIFDTVGGHSSHGSGQYHFEVSDGKLRWYHRNETANQIFSVESDAVVSENTWTHVAGTYDSHTGISKVYIDGHVNGQAQGSGLLSQDWDSHVGIGTHKDSRFINGLLDEFRIYDYAMEEPEIKKLMTLCNYAKSCGGSLDASSGVIASPNWPSGYKDAKTCIWKITVDKTDKIALNFETFGLQEDGNCDKSRLVIKDGEDEAAKEIGEFCGLNSPRLMRSTGNHMWLQFTSTPEGEGKGFRLTYQTEKNRQTKKEEQPRAPDQNMKCSASTPEYNVTLSGGIKAGSFSEALGVKTLDMCMRQCCLKESCSLAFMISDSCYLVNCKDEESCKTKRARPSGMNPTIVYITHLKEEPHSGLPEEGTSLDNPRPIPPASQCHHTDVSYNFTLVGGIKAGKFNTFGHMSSIDDCIRHCCHDDKCDVVFMIQNNCYNVECANNRGCQMKKAKPSPYNPTLVYVYRGGSKPIAEPVKKFNRPARFSCHNYQVSNTLQNVTLVGGIKSGTFTDKGVVNDIDECKAFCCAEDSCNVAFLIRTNCFLVACKDYDSCKVKPAMSDYYRPKLAYVNWHPPDEEVSPYDKFASLGCWRDTESFAIPSLEGTDPRLSESYRLRAKPIDTCASVAFKHGYKVFGIHRGGACFSGPKADQTFNIFGESADCKSGRGGVGATDVYRLDHDGKYSKLGCWRDTQHRALKKLEHTNPRLNDFYQTRTSPVAKCAEVAKQQGYPVFAIQDGGECLSGPTAEDEFNKYGVSRDCRGRLGGAYANSVYKLIGNFDIQNDELDNSSSTMNTTENSSNKDSMSKPEGGTKQVIGDDLPSKTGTTSMREDFVTLKNGKPKRIVYMAGKVQYNVTLKYGIKSGKFMDEGQVSNISQCISRCGRQPDCDLAFMLGKQCFAVSCSSKALCITKPAFSLFYNPVIVFVTHRKIYDTVKSQQRRCHVSAVQNNVTLVGGINAGKFMELKTDMNSEADMNGETDMNTCIKWCCAKPTCDVAFKLEGVCYAVSCISNNLCKTRPARNAERYNPQIAYVYHDRKGLDRVQESSNTSIHGDSSSNGSVCWDGDVLYNQTLIGGINAGVFTDNGKTTTMDLCMQSCCKQPACDLAFMIEDDCYSVACTSPSSCKTRAARPTQFYPRISFRNKFKDMMSKETSGLASGTSAPQEPSTQSPTHAAASSAKVTTTVAPRVQPTLKVQHSCSATPIKYNVTLRMGLHSGLFTKMGRVDSMDDCIELNCKQPKADVAFMMGTHCYAVQCYSEELCKTEPVFATSFSFLNLKPAVSFLKKNPGSTGHDLALRENPRETCLESTITYDVTLRGGIHAGKFTERPHVNTMRKCIRECCDADSCDLAFMFGDRCYSVTCKSEKSCQAVLAKPTSLKPRISYMSRTSPNNDGVSLAESQEVHPKCHADDISKSLIARNKTLAGGLEAGTFRFLGKVKSMGFCMRMCCARPRCDVAYLIDKNCFSITCFSPALCKITSDHSTANGDVEISAMLKSVKKEELPDEAHSVVVYIIVGTLMFAAGLGGIVWAVCMFLRRHRLRQRHRARSPSDG